jgi:hypothetical protein
MKSGHGTIESLVPVLGRTLGQDAGDLTASGSRAVTSARWRASIGGSRVWDSQVKRDHGSAVIPIALILLLFLLALLLLLLVVVFASSQRKLVPLT